MVSSTVVSTIFHTALFVLVAVGVVRGCIVTQQAVGAGHTRLGCRQAISRALTGKLTGKYPMYSYEEALTLPSVNYSTKATRIRSWLQLSGYENIVGLDHILCDLKENLYHIKLWHRPTRKLSHCFH